MVEKLRGLLLKYKEQLLYLIFGGLTTAIDWAVTFLLYHFWLDAVGAPEWMVHIADVIAWVAAVTFAYVTNRRWVFDFLPCSKCVIRRYYLGQQKIPRVTVLNDPRQSKCRKNIYQEKLLML